MPSSTPLYSSAASDVYKRQGCSPGRASRRCVRRARCRRSSRRCHRREGTAVSYTHLRAHETKANLVCRLLHLSIRRQRQMCIRDRAARLDEPAGDAFGEPGVGDHPEDATVERELLSLIHISEPTRLRRISYAVFYTSLFVGSVRCV